MSLRIPTFPEILNVARSRGRDSDAPHLWNGLAGAWPMQEGGGGKAFDASGYGNHGTLTSMDPATDWVVTEKGRALNFDGGNDYVDMGDVDSVEGLSAIAISLWLYADTLSSTAGTNRPITKEDAWYFYNANSTEIAFVVHGESDAVKASITTGVWIHLVATFQEGTYAIYKNGDLQSSYTRTTNPLASSVYNLSIGARYSGSGFWEGFWDGRIFGVIIYSHALPPSEIQQLYSDPWAMYRLRSRVFPAAAVGGVAPTSILYGSLVGPFGGPI